MVEMVEKAKKDYERAVWMPRFREVIERNEKVQKRRDE